MTMFFLKLFKPMFFENFDESKAKALYQKSVTLAKEYSAKYTNISRGNGVAVFPITGIYAALQDEITADDAKKMMLDFVPVIGNKMRRIMLTVTELPGVSSALWKNIDKVMRSAGGEQKGYKSKFYGVKDGVAAMDVLVCPVFDAFKEMGVPEICEVICAMDLIYSTGYSGIKFSRTMSVALGDPCCDYRYTKM